MPNAIYDDQEKIDQSTNDSLYEKNQSSESEEDKKSREIRKLERRFDSPPQNNDNLENDSKNKSDDNSSSSFYNPLDKSRKGTSFAEYTATKIKETGYKKLGIFILGPIALIVVILMLMSTLKLPNYAANIAVYRMARSAMDYSKTVSEIDSQKIAIDGSDDTKYKKLTDKYSALRSQTWGKLDRYRPEVLYKNMKGTGSITYKTETVKRLGIPKKQITAVIINGERIPINSQKFGNLIGNYKDRIRFNAQIQANIDKALKGHSTLVRSSVAKKIRSDLNIKLHFWEKAAKNYRGLRADEADRLLLKESTEKSTTKPKKAPITQSVKEGTEAYEKALDACKKKPTCADQLNKGIIPQELTDALKTATEEKMGTKIIGAIGGTYAVVLPACLIYEGSINSAGDTIDSQSASATKTYYSLETMADQQKLGDTSAEAIGAVNRKLGEGDSVPDQYLRGEIADTSVELSPQASATGDFTMLDALLSPAIANTLDSVASDACPVLTDLKVNVAIAAGSVLATFVSGGTTGVASTSISQAIKQVVKKGFLKALEKITTVEGLKETRKGLTGFAKKFARDFIAIEGLTALAKILVLQKSGMINDGATSSGSEFKNQADMGAVVTNNQLEQQMLYGAPLTASSTSALNDDTLKYIASKNNNMPHATKYFGENSILTMKTRNLAFDLYRLKDNGISILASYLNINNLISLFSYKNRVAAAEGINSDYNIVQWGWSKEEQALINKDDSYEMLENDYILESSNKIDEIENRYGKCFSSTFGELLQNGDIIRSENGDVIADKGLCSPNNLGPKNQEGYGDLVFRYRLSKKRLAVLDHNTGIQNPVEVDSGSSLGGESSAPANASAEVIFNQCKQNTATGKVKIVCATRGEGSNAMNGITYGSFWIDKENYDKKPPLLGCNSYANMAIARATNGKYIKNYCSGGYLREGVKEGKFKKIPKSQVEPGDLIIHDRMSGSCGGTSGLGHVEIVVSYDAEKDKLITTGAHGGGRPSGVLDPVSLVSSDYWDYGMEYIGGGL